MPRVSPLKQRRALSIAMQLIWSDARCERCLCSSKIEAASGNLCENVRLRRLPFGASSVFSCLNFPFGPGFI